MKQCNWLSGRGFLLGLMMVGVAIAAPLALADDAADKPAPEKAEPFAVPEDAKAEELLHFIRGLLTTEPNVRDRGELMEHIRKVSAASIEAAEAILNGKATDDEAAQAVQYKLNMLGVAEKLHVPDAAKKRKAFIESIKNDARPAIAALAKQVVLTEQAEGWQTMNGVEKKTFLKALVVHLSDVEIEGEHIGFVEGIGKRLEFAGDPKTAADMYLSVQPFFMKSKNERVADYAKGFEGIARRLTLVGNEMEIEGTLLDGEEFDWSAYKGKVVLVDFWATWCSPCRREIPNVKKAYQQYHDKGFDVVGISLDPPNDGIERVEKYVEQEKIPWAILYSTDGEANGWKHPMATYYGIQGIPAMMLVGQDGKVVTLSARGPELAERLRELLGDPLPIVEDEEDEEDEEGDEDSEEKEEDSDDK